MTDCESGKSFGFLYENREPCHTIALVQLIVTLLTFGFTVAVWWAPLCGIIVAAIGFYGTVEPVTQRKVSFIHFYYWGNWFMLALQLCSAVLLLLIVSGWETYDGWAYTIFFTGSIAFATQFSCTYAAMQRSYSFRAELMRNPPPSEDLYNFPARAHGDSDVPYTSFSQEYRAPSELKTI